MQVMAELKGSSNDPIIIDGMFGIGKTTLAADVALELHDKQQHVFWLYFGADCQKKAGKSSYYTQVLAQQCELYQQITGDKAQVFGQQGVSIPIQNHITNCSLLPATGRSLKDCALCAGLGWCV
jgi:signal recognition particle GTPase